jgi:hypothetical protein
MDIQTSYLVAGAIAWLMITYLIIVYAVRAATKEIKDNLRMMTRDHLIEQVNNGREVQDVYNVFTESEDDFFARLHKIANSLKPNTV